ncbi:MAG TPA: sulfatase [Verrucomicrobiota bacterium]|nr:sulfatase [Verrucomicrobiota bacterium]
MKRIKLVLVLTIVFALNLSGAIQKPNLIVIMADQWRSQATGYAGDVNAKTPNLDTLCSQSVWFVNAVSAVPVCCPARATFMTGQRPLTHGVFMNDVPLSPKAVTIAKVLKNEGYDTAYIGKWHIDGHGRSSFIPKKRRQGFDYWKALECTHNYSNSFYYADTPKKLKWDGYDAFAQTRDAIQYLKNRKDENKPFFLMLSFGPPHSPYHVVPSEYKSLFDPSKLLLRPNIPSDCKNQAKNMLWGYYAHCAALDKCVGDIMQTIDELGISTNTILVFLSDHGDMLGSQGLYRKQKPYEESIRIPLLIRYPALLKSKKADALINFEDIMPTLLGLCNVKIPKTVEGADFSDYLKGGENPNDGSTLISCVAPFGEWSRKTGGKEYRGIRTERYTYVRDLKGPWLLFDNQKDPFQLTNLVNKLEYKDIQDELDKTLSRKLNITKDEFKPADYYIKKWGYKVDATGTVPFAP